MREERLLCGKRCLFLDGHRQAGTPSLTPEALLLTVVGEQEAADLEREAEMIAEGAPGVPFLLAALQISDWNLCLSPWKAPAVFGKEAFGGGAEATLSDLMEILLPEIEGAFPAVKGKPCFLGGYSLSGLFSLWAAYKTDRFAGVAAVSPSLWFPRWEDFMRGHTILSRTVYLSLGIQEEKGRNQALARVGERVRSAHALLSGDPRVERCMLEWNPGNHFTECEARTARGFAWLLSGI